MNFYPVSIIYVKKECYELKRTWSIAAALLDELDNFEVAGALGGTLFVLGGAGVHTDIGFADLLNYQSPK